MIIRQFFDICPIAFIGCIDDAMSDTGFAHRGDNRFWIAEPCVLKVIVAIDPERHESIFDLDDEIDLNGDIERQCGGTERGAGVFAFFAENFDEQF